MRLRNMKTKAIIFEEVATFPVWLDLMRSVFFGMICSRSLEVISSALMDIEMLISIFAKIFPFEYLDCVLFSFFGLPLRKRASLEFLLELLKGTPQISFFVRSFKFFSVICFGGKGTL